MREETQITRGEEKMERNQVSYVHSIRERKEIPDLRMHTISEF
jgi:hypothetical protein